jgi:hypothetical protein
MTSERDESQARGETAPADRGRRPPLGELVLAAPVALGVLVYLGRTYTEAWFGYFRVPTNGLGLSVVDYALRGGRVLGPPMVVLTAVALIASAMWLFLLHMVLRDGEQDAQGRRETLQRAVRVVDAHLRGPKAHRLVPLGVIAVVAGLLLFRLAHHVPAVPTYAVILLLGTGSLLAGLGCRRFGAGRPVLLGAVGLTVLCGVWAATVHAEALGKRKAQGFAQRKAGLTQVLVYSEKSLAIVGPRIERRGLRKTHKYRYRYEGLLLITESDARVYLMAKNWEHGVGRAFVVDRDDEVRFEYIHAYSKRGEAKSR